MPEWARWPERLTWSFRLPPGSREERRCALLLIVSEYAGAGLAPLAGAACDERRIAAMLGENGFSVVQGVGPSRPALLSALASFTRLASKHDSAVIYCTGHGVESAARSTCSRGTTRSRVAALPRGYGPGPSRSIGLRRRAVPRTSTWCSLLVAVHCASRMRRVREAGRVPTANQLSRRIVQSCPRDRNPPSVPMPMSNGADTSALTGRRLGPYKVAARLGAGGMGEVYRARDTKLERDVAIKVLPDIFAADPDRLRALRA